MNNTQTGVEWLFEQLFNSFENYNSGKYTFSEYLTHNLKIREQAKKMEKEQINKACYDGYYQEDWYDVRNYYQETYGKKEEESK